MANWHTKIYTYSVHLPDGVNEAILPCADGYTIYIDIDLDEIQKKKALTHALKHIANNDFEKSDVQEIESDAHTNGGSVYVDRTTRE